MKPPTLDPIAEAWKQSHRIPLPKPLQQTPCERAGIAQAATNGKRKGKHTLPVCVAMLLAICISQMARADHYRIGSLESLMATPNWELVRQDFSAKTGEDIGRPLLIARYRTLAECSNNQAGRLSKTKAGRVARFWCRHRGDDVV